MDEQKFWKLIEAARKDSKGNFDDQVSILIAKLRRLSIKNIIKFDRIFGDYYSKIHSSTIGAAAYLIQNGLSDDRYDYFRAWLIGQGKDIYMMAVANPDDLAELDSIILAREFSGEELLYAASEAYEEKTGEENFDELLLDQEINDIPEVNTYWDVKMDWIKDGQLLEEKLQPMLPKLYQRFKGNDNNIS